MRYFIAPFSNILLSSFFWAFFNETDLSKLVLLLGATRIFPKLKVFITTSLSAMIGAFKDRNRQCKAICVKALNSGSRKKDATADEVGKNESAADIFADVEII